jgi:hypothetical protein
VVLRVLGATRGQAALAAALPAVIPVLGGAALAVAGAMAISPLAPVGPVRRLDPDRGISADGLVLGAGTAVFCLALVGLLAVLAVRSVRPRASGAGVGSCAVARAAAAAGLPAAAVVGTRNAFEPGAGVRAVPVRSALLGSIAAITAVVTAVVFSASLSGLSTPSPARSGSCRSSRSRCPPWFSGWPRWCWRATCWRRCPRPWPRGPGPASA